MHKLFISSTREDLKPFRVAASEAALAADVHPIQMEYFSANGKHRPLDVCLQKVDESDVVVLIVAYRYGWVPHDQDGDEQKSITWLECERANASGKEVLAFVVNPAYEDWDAKLKEEYRLAVAAADGKATPDLLDEVQRATQRLKDFKAWIDGNLVRNEFTTPENLGQRVTQAIADWKQRHATANEQAADGAPPSSPQPIFPLSYRQWLLRDCAEIPLVGLRLKEGRAVTLNHVYVPLTTPARQNEALKHAPPGEFAKGGPDFELLLHRLGDESLYVAGPPGSGKSTFCRWVVWLAAAGAAPETEVPAPDGYVESLPESLASRLPLLVRLRDMWNYLPKDAGRDRLSQTELESALGNWLDTTNPGGLDWADVAPHLDAGSGLLILDGVDEVPLRVGEGREAYYPRAMLLAGIIDAAANWQDGGNRILLTSRPYGIRDDDVRKLSLAAAPMRDLDDALQNLLVNRWFRILKDDAQQAERTANDMLVHLAGRPELSALKANPMLLTAVCIIYHEGKRLPQDKHDLYERIVDNVLHNRYGSDVSELEMAREHLSVIAHGMHTGAGLGEQRAAPQAEADYKEIDRMLQAYREESAVTFAGYKGALETRDELLQRSGLLLSRGDQTAGFYHFTFQDFLAARRMGDIERDGLFDIFCQRAEADEWRSTLSFLFSSELANSREQATRLLNRLIEKLTPDSLGLAVVAADCLETMLQRETRLRDDVREKFESICLTAIEKEVDVKARNTLGTALGLLGDPRVVVDLRDASAYVKIPAGEYAYQDGKHTIDEPFMLAKYPVTNSQFALFMDQRGYHERAHWSKEGWQWKEEQGVSQPGYWRDAKYNAPNQPVVGVSFYESEAFCKWAGGFLPSEQQWEAAARGSDGLEYPWGNDWEAGICNSWEAELRTLSAVGLFPRSTSRDLQLVDMAGNVFEWCDSLYQENDKRRVLRGGSFLNLAPLVRSAYRGNYNPDYRYSIFGFRLARTYN